MQPSEQKRRQIEAERELASDRFPNEWKATLAMPGHRRRVRQKSLRDAAKSEIADDRVRAKGGNCDSCTHLLRNPAGLNGLYCSLDSDFHGFCRIPASRLCGRWQIDGGRDG